MISDLWLYPPVSSGCWGPARRSSRGTPRSTTWSSASSSNHRVCEYLDNKWVSRENSPHGCAMLIRLADCAKNVQFSPMILKSLRNGGRASWRWDDPISNKNHVERLLDVSAETENEETYILNEINKLLYRCMPRNTHNYVSACVGVATYHLYSLYLNTSILYVEVLN